MPRSLQPRNHRLRASLFPTPVPHVRRARAPRLHSRPVRRPGVLGSEPVLHADDGDAERIGKALVTDVVRRCGTHVEAPAVAVQEDACHPAGRGVNSQRNVAPVGTEDANLSWLVGGRGPRCPGANRLKLFETARAPALGPVGVERTRLCGQEQIDGDPRGRPARTSRRRTIHGRAAKWPEQPSGVARRSDASRRSPPCGTGARNWRRVRVAARQRRSARRGSPAQPREAEAALRPWTPAFIRRAAK